VIVNKSTAPIGSVIKVRRLFSMELWNGRNYWFSGGVKMESGTGKGSWV